MFQPSGSQRAASQLFCGHRLQPQLGQSHSDGRRRFNLDPERFHRIFGRGSDRQTLRLLRQSDRSDNFDGWRTLRHQLVSPALRHRRRNLLSNHARNRHIQGIDLKGTIPVWISYDLLFTFTFYFISLNIHYLFILPTSFTLILRCTQGEGASNTSKNLVIKMQ